MRRLALSLILLSSVSEAMNPACLRIVQDLGGEGFLSVPFSETKISDAMKQLPELGEMLVEMMNDPQVPGGLKRIIKSSIETEATTVVELTKKVREVYGIPKYFNAVHARKNSPLEYFSAEQTLNQKASAEVQKAMGESGATTTGEHTVFLPKEEFGPINNPLITLLHELSHVRFDSFFEKNVEKIAKNFPPSLIRKSPDGHWMVNKHLHDLLSERYAHQTEYSVLRATYGRYFDEWYRRYGSPGDQISEAAMDRLITDYIVKTYKISDPEILNLRNRKVSDILVRGIKNEKPLDAKAQEQLRLMQQWSDND
jgi:hypothetical protein